jgi:hypothetical protein
MSLFYSVPVTLRLIADQIETDGPNDAIVDELVRLADTLRMEVK